MLTEILMLALSAVFGGVAGYLVARHQDRARARERLQGVAGAVWADIQRIRQEMGEPRDQIIELNVQGSESIPPTVHEWIQDLVPELARIHPDALVDYFLLERALHNHGMSLKTFRRAHEALAAARERLEAARAWEDLADDELPEAFAEHLRAEAQRQREVRNLEDSVELWEHSAVDSRKGAYRIMERIEKRIFDYLPATRQVELIEATGTVMRADE